MFAAQFKASDVDHSHTKRADSLGGILDRVLFGSYLGFWVSFEYYFTSNTDNECVRK